MPEIPAAANAFQTKLRAIEFASLAPNHQTENTYAPYRNINYIKFAFARSCLSSVIMNDHSLLPP